MKYEQMNNNKTLLFGKIVEEPAFSHETFGEGFYEIKMSVARLSDHCDIIPVTISEKLIDNSFVVGKSLAIKGQFRSYNKQEGDKSKLLLTVFAREIIDFDDSMNPNIIEIVGYICKPPIYRTTPFKREICDILVAVNRSYNKSDYLPCIAWGRNARFIKNVDVGSKVEIVGRVQSREYQKKTETGDIENKIAYEISVNKIMIDGATSDFEENENEAINLWHNVPKFTILCQFSCIYWLK